MDMLRGIQKRMIVYKPPSDSHFEYAYFVLREDKKALAEDKDAILREAGKILAEEKKKPRRASAHALRRSLWLFFGGMACGALPICLVWIFS